jgi:DNA-binding SARP family transcriptional activator
LPRDRALALLWPELDSERARNNLKQLVFSLRRALSPDVFAASGPALRLDPNTITVDVWAYEKAIAEGALESAVSRYGGPFLDGFNVPGLTEFERWLETERERLARVHAETLDTLAERATRDGHFEIAAAWRRHLAALDPLSGRYAVAFVRALADAGDVPGALRHAHLFERLIRSELDADVGPEMRLLVAQLRLRAGNGNGLGITSGEIEILATEPAPKGSVESSAVQQPSQPEASKLRKALRAVTPRINPRRFAIVCLAVANVIVFRPWRAVSPFRADSGHGRSTARYAGDHRGLPLRRSRHCVDWAAVTCDRRSCSRLPSTGARGSRRSPCRASPSRRLVRNRMTQWLST